MIDPQVDDNSPLLSVVLPVYNVERYIGTALESLSAQTYENFEVIMVDDGSVDGSADICRQFAQRDARFKLIRQDNAGVSAARNKGIDAANGDYLTFIDGDDELWDDAYELMIGRALETGAEVVSGNVHRFKGTKTWQSWHHKVSHSSDRSNTTLSEVPELLYDTVIWNKVFSMAFWKRSNFSFPTGVIFEDMYLAYRAYDQANHIDIVSKPVYKWRVRDENSSATQQKGSLKNVVDREAAMRDVYEAILARNDKNLLDVFFGKIIDGDLWFNISGISDDVPEFNAALSRLVKFYWPRVPASIRMTVSQERRTVYSALQRNQPLSVPAIQEWYSENRYDLPISCRGSRVSISKWRSPSFLRHLSASDRDLIRETTIDCVATDLKWTDELTFAVHGWAYVPLLSVGKQEIDVVLRNGTEEFACEVQRVESPLAFARGKNPKQSYANVGFVAKVDITKLGKLCANNSKWIFVVRIRSGKVLRESNILRVWRGGSAAVVGPKELPKRRRVVPVVAAGRPLSLDVRKPKNWLTSLKIVDRTITGTVSVPKAALLQTAELVGGNDCSPVKLSVEIVSAEQVSFAGELPEITDGVANSWRFRIVTAEKDAELAWSESATVDLRQAANGLDALPTPRGWTVIHDRFNVAIVDEVSVDENLTLRLVGRWVSKIASFHIAVPLNGQDATVWFPVDLEPNGETFTVDVPLTKENWYGEHRPWPSGRYDIVATTDVHGTVADSRVVIGDVASQEFPFRFYSDRIQVQMDRIAGAGIALRLKPPVPELEQGSFAIESRRMKYAPPAAVVPEASVFFRTDMGASAGDSALAIQLELQRRGADLKYYWAVKDHSIPIPPGGIAVIDGTDMWTEKIASSMFVVNNYGAIVGYLDHDHQTYVQTWHGTPLKIIGLSEWRYLNGSQEWLEQKKRSASEWDYLVTASPFCTELLPTEFLYEGEVLELGMPRNDRVALAQTSDRDEILRKLGIDPSQKVVLYAPTYRDSLRDKWRAEAYDGLDLNELSRQLGPGWTILSRGHSFNKRAGSVFQAAERVVDVTFHPDISDLYVASDMCVTDYSSVMFDYSVSKKPLYFFVPDYEDYLSTRPMYMNLTEIAPSPLCKTLGELVAELQDSSNYGAKYGEEYESFRIRFAPHDDGNSAKRVVDQIFVPKLKEANIRIDDLPIAADAQ